MRDHTLVDHLASTVDLAVRVALRVADDGLHPGPVRAEPSTLVERGDGSLERFALVRVRCGRRRDRSDHADLDDRPAADAVGTDAPAVGSGMTSSAVAIASNGMIACEPRPDR